MFFLKRLPFEDYMCICKPFAVICKPQTNAWKQDQVTLFNYSCVVFSLDLLEV